MSLNCLLAKYFIYDIYDNNESAPELLFKKVGGKVEVSKNYPNLYNMSISSSPPYFSLNSSGGRKTKHHQLPLKNE